MAHSDRIRNKAAMAIADGRKTQADIAKTLDIGLKTLTNWLDEADFTAKVEEYRGVLEDALIRETVADRVARVSALNRVWHGLLTTIDERAEDPDLQGVPGGQTGLIVHTTKMVGTGRNAQTIDEYAVDTGLIKELRAVQEAAAIELGQRVKTMKVEGGETPVRFTIKIDDGGRQTAARMPVAMPADMVRVLEETRGLLDGPDRDHADDTMDADVDDLVDDEVSADDVVALA